MITTPKQPSLAELKPCPFCGGEGQAEYAPRPRERLFGAPWQVHCFTCGTRSRRQPSKEGAEGAWNIRTPVQQPQAGEDVVEAMQTAIEVLDYIFQACMCERFKTEGFDYYEKHPRMGIADAGSRWNVPRGRITGATARLTEAIAALQDQSPPAAAAQHWRPIKSAPRDGMPITVAMTVRWMPYKPQSRKEGLPEGRWQSANGYGGWDNLGWEPTHWTNNPAPAAQSTDSQT